MGFGLTMHVKQSQQTVVNCNTILLA